MMLAHAIDLTPLANGQVPVRGRAPNPHDQVCKIVWRKVTPTTGVDDVLGAGIHAKSSPFITTGVPSCQGMGTTGYGLLMVSSDAASRRDGQVVPVST